MLDGVLAIVASIFYFELVLAEPQNVKWADLTYLSIYLSIYRYMHTYLHTLVCA